MYNCMSNTQARRLQSIHEACTGQAFEHYTKVLIGLGSLYIALYLAMACLTVSCWSAGTMQMNFSIVPTGPPQHGKQGLRYPGAWPPTVSSIAFFAASFMASIATTKS